MSKQSGSPALAGPAWRDPKGTLMTTDWRSVMLYPIPSIIYLFHNNVQFYTMAYVDGGETMIA